MHLVVLDTLPYADVVVERIEATKPPSSIIHITADNPRALKQRSNIRPIYSDKLWAIIHLGNDSKLLRELTDVLGVDWINLIILCSDVKTFRTAKNWFEEKNIQIEIFNCYKVSYFAKLRYIRKVYKEVSNGGTIDNKTISVIAKRLNGNERQLENIFRGVFLKYGCLNLPALRKAMPVKSYVTRSNLMLHMFGRKAEERDMVTVKDILRRDRWYSTPILKDFQNFIDSWLKLYPEFLNGNLSQDTFQIWVVDHGKEFKVETAWEAKQWLHSFETYSYELMQAINLALARHRRVSSESAYCYMVLTLCSI